MFVLGIACSRALSAQSNISDKMEEASFREEIAKKLQDEFNIQINPDDIKGISTPRELTKFLINSSN
ncbi:MAG: phosphopantetheine-binding protein [Patescibacteria group bacterium]|nr:phosphopantetheine-binding protein [Patescibacteria group bacterium]